MAVMEIALEVGARSKDGFPPRTVRTVAENCLTLRSERFSFDEG
jgi:hypothetical protein